MSKRAWMIGVVFLFLTGCQSAESTLSPSVNLPRPAYRAGIGGWSVKSRPLMVRVYGSGDDVVLLMAGIHGNEAAGVPILERLGQELMAQPELLVGRTVVILPVVNPDGVKANKRRRPPMVMTNNERSQERGALATPSEARRRISWARTNGELKIKPGMPPRPRQRQCSPTTHVADR